MPGNIEPGVSATPGKTDVSTASLKVMAEPRLIACTGPRYKFRLHAVTFGFARIVEV